jgi:hypothetical protein
MWAICRAPSKSTNRSTVPVDTLPPSIQPVKESTSVALSNAGQLPNRKKSFSLSVMKACPPTLIAPADSTAIVADEKPASSSLIASRALPD